MCGWKLTFIFRNPRLMKMFDLKRIFSLIKWDLVSDFRAVSEQQVVQQVVQNKRFEEVDVRESMTHLCKKLAEKRVFGSKLMAETTVAGLNHSTFPNLPIEGIMYIQRTFLPVFYSLSFITLKDVYVKIFEESRYRKRCTYRVYAQACTRMRGANQLEHRLH